MKKSLTLYYDPREKETNGFYPQTFYSDGMNEIVIDFIFTDGCWKQDTEDCIDELDTTERNKILYLLNDDRYSSKIIVDPLGYLI
jgi:hypothetical protein